MARKTEWQGVTKAYAKRVLRTRGFPLADVREAFTLAPTFRSGTHYAVSEDGRKVAWVICDGCEEWSIRIADAEGLEGTESGTDIGPGSAEKAVDATVQAPVTEVAPNVVVIAPEALGDFLADLNASVPTEVIDRVRTVTHSNGIVQVFATAQARATGESAIGAYQRYGDSYRTYARDGSSLGTWATETDAYAAISGKPEAEADPGSDYTRDYNNGWRAAGRGDDTPGTSHAWHDGYNDYARGMDKWTEPAPEPEA